CGGAPATPTPPAKAGAEAPKAAAPAPTAAPAPASAAAPTSAAAATATAPAPAAAPATKAPVTIRVWERINPGYAELFGETIPLFQAKNPGVQMKYEPSDEQFDKLTASMVAGNAPEVFTTYDQFTRAFVANNQLRPLGEYADRDLTDAQRSDFYPDTI